MSVAIDTFNASFNHYMPGVIRVLNNTIAAKRLTKGNVKKWEGSKLIKYVHLGRNGAINFVEDGSAIPPSQRQNYQPSEAFRKIVAGSVAITDGMMANASTVKHAAIRVVESELRGMMEDVRNFYNYFWTRDGTGVVTLLGATADGATFTVDDARGLWDGVAYSILDSATPAVTHQTFTVKSISRTYNNALRSATVTPESTLASGSQVVGDFVTWGTGAYNSYNKALTGLDAGIETHSNTFQGIDTAVWTKYSSPVLSNGGTPRPLTPNLLRRMISMLVQEGGASGRTIDLITDVWLCEEFDKLYESAVRITPDTTTTGTATPVFQSTQGKVRVNQDKDCPYGTMFFMDSSQVTLAMQKELHWRPASSGGGGSGGQIFKRDDAMLRYTATCMEQSELFYEGRNRMGKITDLTETVGTAF